MRGYSGKNVSRRASGRRHAAAVKSKTGIYSFPRLAHRGPGGAEGSRAVPCPHLGGDRSAGRAHDTDARPASRAAPGSTRRPSTSPSAPPPTAARAGRRPRASPRSSTRPAPTSPTSSASASGRARPAAPCRPRRCRCSASPRPAPAASSTTAAFRPGRAGTRSTFPATTATTSLRSRSAAIRCCRSIATATAIIVARDTPCRKGDRVVVKTRDGEVMAKVLQQARRRASIDLASLNPDHPDRTLSPCARSTGSARIIWASQ